MATNSTPLSQLTSNNSYNNDKINQSVKKDNNGLTSADLLNCNKVEIKGDQPLKNNIISNYTDVSAVPSIDLNLMNKMSVINNIQGLNESKINNENITNSYNINPLTNEKLNQLLMTVALNNNVDIDKMVNYTSSNNIIMNTMTGRNETNNENIDLNNNTNNNHNKNLDNGNNINNNDSNLSNSYLNQEFLLQLLQQQQQLQQQLYILQQQQLHKNNEVNHDINIIPNQKKDINSFAYNNTNNSPSLLYSSNGLEVKENNQDFYQYFSQMSDSSTSKINSSSISIPSYTLPVSSRPMSTSSHTTYSLNPKIMSFPVSVNPNFNERNNDLINYEKQEFTKPPKVPSHLISSSLTNNGINNYNNGNDGKANEYLDEKKKLKDFQSKSMSPIIATVAPMTISNSNNDPIININLSLQENSYLKKDDLDVSKNKSLSNSSSTSLSSTTTLENDKNALDSSGTTFLLNEESNIIQRKNSKNSSTTSSNSTLTLFPNANNESDSKNSNNFKQSKISNNSETDIDNKIESIKVIEGTSSVSTPKLINSTSESKNNDNNNTLLSTKNISESIEALKLNDSQEIISKTDSSDNLGTTPNASSSNKYLSAISSVSNDDQRSSIIGSNDKTTELPILRIGQPISDLSNGGLMVNSGNVNANGISNSFSDGFDLLNIPNYRLSYLSSRDFSNNLNNITNNELLSVNNSINSNRLSDNNNLNNTNDKKEIDFLSFNLSIENPSSSLSDNKNLFPPSAAIPIYKNNKNLNSSNNSNNINNSLLNDGSLNGFFTSPGSLHSDNKMLNSFSNKFRFYDNSINNNNSTQTSTSSTLPAYNNSSSTSLPISINRASIKDDNSRDIQQQHLNQISETPDLWEFDMEPYFEHSSVSKDESNWFSINYKNYGPSLNNVGGNNSYKSNFMNNNQVNIDNSVELHSNNNDKNDNNTNSVDFQHLNYPFNINSMKQNNMNMVNQGSSIVNNPSTSSSVIDKNIWNSLIPSLLSNNIDTTNTINKSISLLQKTIASSNIINDNDNKNSNNNNNSNNNSSGNNNDNNNNNNNNDNNNNNNNNNDNSNNNNNKDNNNDNKNNSLSPLVGFNDNLGQTNNLQIINQINEIGNPVNNQTCLLNNSNSSSNTDKIYSSMNNLHPTIPSNSASTKYSATISKPINIRNPEKRDYISASYNNRLIPNTPSSSFSSYFSTSPNSYFSVGGYSGTNIPAAPNNSYSYGVNFKNNLNVNNSTSSTNKNIESWISNSNNANVKTLEPPLIEVPRTWFFPKDEISKNSETIVLPKRFFKNEIPECYDNRDFMVMSYNILAPSYCTTEKFELTNPKYLDWEYRKKLILDEIAYYRADIICLQEVSPYDFNTWLFPQLQKLGYDGLYQPKKKKNSFDGCATFYCHSKFQLLIVQAFRYNDISLTEEKENVENKLENKNVDSKEKSGENGTSNEEKNKKESENNNLNMNNNNNNNNNNNKNNKNSKYNQVTVNTTPDPSIFISSRKQSNSGRKIDLTKELLNVNPDLNVKDQESFIRDTTLRVKPFSNVALIAIFRNKFTNSRLRVVNTHFHWDPVYADTKLLQASILMDWLSKSYQHPTVVCGDLNSKNGDPVMNYILNGKIDTGNFLGRNFGKFTKDKYLYHNNGLQESYQASDIPFTNRTPDFCGTIDHILYTNESLKLRNVLCGTVDQNRYLNEIKSLPNKWFPSDHLLLLSAFRELREPHHRSRRDSFSYNNYSSSAPVRHSSYLNDQSYNRVSINAKNKNNNNNINFNYSNSYSTSNNVNNNTSNNMMSSSYNSNHVYSSSIPNNARNNHYKGNSNIDFFNPNNSSYKQKSILSTSISSSLHSLNNNANANNNGNCNDANNKMKTGENSNISKKGIITTNDSNNSTKNSTSNYSKSETFKKSSPILINNKGNHNYHQHYNGHSYNSFKHQSNYFEKDYKKK